MEDFTVDKRRKPGSMFMRCRIEGQEFLLKDGEIDKALADMSRGKVMSVVEMYQEVDNG